MMEDVCKSGTGRNGYVAGYRIAGKTGTTQKYQLSGTYIASFACFAPADNPEIALLLIVDEPASEMNGSTVCAPWAAKIMEDRTRASAFINHTVREYEGLLRNVGDSVTIKGAGKVAFTHTADGKPIQLGEPQTPEGTNAILTVKQQDAFNFMVPDIDAAQGAKDAL